MTGNNKFEELKEKMRRYECMESIAKEYRSMIRKIDYEKDAFHIHGIEYSARSDPQKFEVNSYYAPIPYTIIREGFQSALDTLEIEISLLKEELKEWL